MDSFKNFIMKPPVKSTVISVLTVFTSITIAVLGDWSKTQDHFWIKIAVFSFSVLLYLLALFYYATNEVNDRRAAALMEKQIKTFEGLLTDVVSICSLNSKEYNTCLNKIKENQEIDLNIWSFDKACNSICACVYNSACKIGKSKDFSVSYVKLIEDEENMVVLNAYANKMNTTPTVYMEKRRFDIDEGTNRYHDLELFEKNSEEFDIMINSEEIDDAFGYKNKQSRKNNKHKYRQYLAIPVFCNETKMIGLLEVATLNDTILGLSREEVEEVASKYFLPYANMLLMLYKMEKALLISTKND